MNIMDIETENMIKARQSFDFLVKDLMALTPTENPFIGDAALEMLVVVREAERKMKRLMDNCQVASDSPAPAMKG